MSLDNGTSTGVLDRLIEDLIRLERLDARDRMRRRRDAGDVIRMAATDALRREGRAHVTTLRVDVAPDLDEIDAVAHMVTAFCSNAAKHTPIGSCIWITVETRDGATSITVADEGPGIPDTEKASIFSLPERHGCRRGLHLAHRVARAHSGKAWVEDRLGGGATFRATFGVDACAQTAS